MIDNGCTIHFAKKSNKMWASSLTPMFGRGKSLSPNLDLTKSKTFGFNLTFFDISIEAS